MHTGACHCKKVTYLIKGAKTYEFLCHCSDCRVLNGGGHLSGIVFKEEDFSYEGKVQEYQYKGGSGELIHAHFCPNCSTGLFGLLDSHKGVVVVRANTLDDASIFTPQKSLFAEEAFAWDTVLPSRE